MIRAAILGVLGVLTQAGDCSHGSIVIGQKFTASEIRELAGQPAAAGAAGSAAKSKLPAVGDVLIAGGVSAKKSTTKAQFYDPSTKKFTKTGALITDRGAPCALALPLVATPQILVAGGAQGSASTKNGITLTLTPLSSAEEYDPATGTFSTLMAAMTAPRMGCTATILNDGSILIAGGLDATGAPHRNIQSGSRHLHCHHRCDAQPARFPHGNRAYNGAVDRGRLNHRWPRQQHSRLLPRPDTQNRRTL
jgi:hypothetical protein